jgi:hypothetical protein
MTPSACVMIRRCAGLLAARRLRAVRRQPSQMGRFETQWLAAPENLSAIADLSGQWIDLVHGRRPPRSIVLNMDSRPRPVKKRSETLPW